MKGEAKFLMTVVFLFIFMQLMINGISAGSCKSNEELYNLAGNRSELIPGQTYSCARVYNLEGYTSDTFSSEDCMVKVRQTSDIIDWDYFNITSTGVCYTWGIIPVPCSTNIQNFCKLPENRDRFISYMENSDCTVKQTAYGALADFTGGIYNIMRMIWNFFTISWYPCSNIPLWFNVLVFIPMYLAIGYIVIKLLISIADLLPFT